MGIQHQLMIEESQQPRPKLKTWQKTAAFVFGVVLVLLFAAGIYFGFRGSQRADELDALKADWKAVSDEPLTDLIDGVAREDDSDFVEEFSTTFRNRRRSDKIGEADIEALFRKKLLAASGNGPDYYLEHDARGLGETWRALVANCLAEAKVHVMALYSDAGIKLEHRRLSRPKSQFKVERGDVIRWVWKAVLGEALHALSHEKQDSWEQRAFKALYAQDVLNAQLKRIDEITEAELKEAVDINWTRNHYDNVVEDIGVSIRKKIAHIAGSYDFDLLLEAEKKGEALTSAEVEEILNGIGENSTVDYAITELFKHEQKSATYGDWKKVQTERDANKTYSLFDYTLTELAQTVWENYTIQRDVSDHLLDRVVKKEE